jgi:hypothetical protein
VIAAGTIAAARRHGDPELTADVAEATVSWAADHVLAVLPGRRMRPPVQADEPVLDPHDDVNAVRWLRHRGAVACGAVGALATAGADPGWLRSALAWVGSVVEVTAAQLPAPSPASALPGAAVLDRDGRAGGPALVSCWAGPANLRALAGDARPADRDWLNERLAADRGGNYARALALMRGVNGERSRAELAWWAALSSELPIPLSFAETFLDLMSRAGWMRVQSRGGLS